jgi:hypothetical protein
MDDFHLCNRRCFLLWYCHDSAEPAHCDARGAFLVARDGLPQALARA